MWKEDQGSEKHIIDEMKNVKMMPGLTRDQITDLKTGKITGEQLADQLRESGDLPLSTQASIKKGLLNKGEEV